MIRRRTDTHRRGTAVTSAAGRGRADAGGPRSGPPYGEPRPPRRGPQPTPDLNTGVLPGNVHADDWVMLTLAVIALGLLGYVVLSPPPPDVGRWLFYADCVVCGIFALEFLWRWRKRRWKAAFLGRTWYELFAVLPVAHPAMVSHHFIITVLLLARLARVADRAVGEQFMYRLVDKFAEPIVHAVKKPVTVAVLDEVVKVLETGNYPENLAKSLTANQSELQSIIREKISQDQQLGVLKRLPFSDEVVQALVETGFRVVLEVLQDPRIDDFFAAVVRDNREQIRRAVLLGLNEVDTASDIELLPTRTEAEAAREFDRNHPHGRRR
jgi:voltage-gated potassium channel